ncbi:MAG: hypothetical protein WKF86_07940 [Acidimicrobiales bacterium]
MLLATSSLFGVKATLAHGVSDGGAPVTLSPPMKQAVQENAMR